MHIFFAILIVLLLTGGLAAFSGASRKRSVTTGIALMLSALALFAVLLETNNLAGPPTQRQAVVNAQRLGARAEQVARGAHISGPAAFVMANDGGNAQIVETTPEWFSFTVSDQGIISNTVRWACLKAGVSTMTYEATAGKCPVHN